MSRILRPTASKTALLLACQHWARHDVAWEPYATSEAADRGNRFHAVMDAYVKDGDALVVDRDLVRDVAAAKAWLAARRSDADRGIIISEQVYSYDTSTGWCSALLGVTSRSYPQVEGLFYGTADLVYVLGTDPKTIVVADWKTGDGSKATAQLRTLALMATRAMGARAAHVAALEVSDGSVREVCVEHLDEFALAEHELALRAAIAAIPTAEPRVGDHCSAHWCPARANCPAAHESAEQLVPVDSLVRHRLGTEITGPEHAVWMLERVRLVEAACKAVKAAIKGAVPADGWTLEDGSVLRDTTRKMRRFDEDAALEMLSKLGATEEMVQTLYDDVIEPAGLRVTKPSAKKRGRAA